MPQYFNSLFILAHKNSHKERFCEDPKMENIVRNV